MGKFGGVRISKRIKIFSFYCDFLLPFFRNLIFARELFVTNFIFIVPFPSSDEPSQKDMVQFKGLNLCEGVFSHKFRENTENLMDFVWNVKSY
jgi:hypothetical protein